MLKSLKNRRFKNEYARNYPKTLPRKRNKYSRS
nr:MAG TPA: hypothetical protein [Caudoviricetes sp.]